MATIQELFEEYNVDVNILGNMSGVNSGHNHLSQEYRDASQSDESRKAEILKLAPVLENGTLKKSAIVRHVQDSGGRLSHAQASQWLKEIVPIVKRKEAAVEAPVASSVAPENKPENNKVFTVREPEFYAIQHLKKNNKAVWEEALKEGFTIKKERAIRVIEKQYDAERDAFLAELTKPIE